MSDLGRGTAVADALLEIAGPELYRRNAFRITGVATDAGGRAVRERRQKMTTTMAVRGPVPDEVQAAFGDLGDDRRRIVHELFWLWGDVADCGCPSSLHDDHDNAVRAHAEALDREHAGTGSTADELWQAAAQLWSNVSRRVAFWNHVRHRMDALGDKRLDESSIDALRDALPRALVAPTVALAVKAQDPGRLVAHAAQWNVGGHVVATMLEEAAEPALRNVDDALDRAVELLDGGNFHAAAEVIRQIGPELDRLKPLLPGNREVAVARNRAATILNNCGVAVGNEGGSMTAIRPWFQLAIRLTEDPESHSTFERNLADGEARERMAHELQPFGVSPEDAPSRVTELAEAGRFREAEALLLVVRRHSTDPDETAQIDRLLAQLASARRASTGYQRPVQPSQPSPSQVLRGGVVWLAIAGGVWWIFGAVAGGIAVGIVVLILVLALIGAANAGGR